MFDIGFWELLLIGVVGLLVVGPQRLPAVATMLGQWVGRLRRFANHMRDEIQQELETEHLKQVMDEQNREMQSLREEMSSVRRQAEASTEMLNEPAADAPVADEPGASTGPEVESAETEGESAETQDERREGAAAPPQRDGTGNE